MLKAQLRFMHPSPLVTTESSLYQLPSFPPPNDWVISIDDEGQGLSCYGDDYWDFHAFGYPGFNFGRHKLSDLNLSLVKQALLLVMYHPNLFPGTIQSCRYVFRCLVIIAKICDEWAITICDLSRFPQLYSQVALALKGSTYDNYLSLLHKLGLYVDELGYEIANKKMLAFLASQSRDHEIIQFPYIPPRIWSYQVNRLNECMEDFLKHQESLENAFTWLSEAYEHNRRLNLKGTGLQSPFCQRELYQSQRKVFEGNFEHFLNCYGLMQLQEKWLGRYPQPRVIRLASLFNLFRDAALLFILNFSMQRISEAMSLRADCLIIEQDERLGEIMLLIGETTKTDSDNDARWVVPKTVKKAVDVAATIAKWRLRHQPTDTATSKESGKAPFLRSWAWEPWARGDGLGKLRPSSLDYGTFVSRYPNVFEREKITVTEDDWKIALSLTPNLGKKAEFGIGLPWKFSAHQLRRTTSVNMFASNMVTDHSLQWNMKHLSREMTLYYGRNYTNLRLNSEVETAVTVESYRAIYRQLRAVVEDFSEFVRPHAKETFLPDIINLIDRRDEKAINALIKQDKVGCRKILLGICVKPGSCEYGGIESVAKCAGADGKGVCADVIFERKKAPELSRLKQSHERELKNVERNSLRYGYLKKEIYAIGIYLDVINKSKNG